MKQREESKGFPVMIECVSSRHDLQGKYKQIVNHDLIDVMSRFSTIPSQNTTYVYKKLSDGQSFLAYCEGIPELLPSSIWEIIASDDLAGNAEANMSAAVTNGGSSDLCSKVCGEIMRISIEVAEELVGWFMFSQGEYGEMFPLARCIQRASDDEFTASHRPYFTLYLDALWEVRKESNACASSPGWVRQELEPRWATLMSQSGCFENDASFGLRQIVATPILTRPLFLSETEVMRGPVPGISKVEKGSFVWNLGACAGELEMLKEGKAVGLMLVAFMVGKSQSFSVEISPMTGSGMISVALVRMNRSDEDTRFTFCIGGASSGAKQLDSVDKKFTVLMDPRLVFGCKSVPDFRRRTELLRNYRLLIDFIGVDHQ